MKCPHCVRGKLIKRPDRSGMYSSGFAPQPYDCDICGREWSRDEKGNWISFGATIKEIFSPDGKTLLRHD